MSEWKPIETAPKDGTYVILAHFGDDLIEVCGGEWNLWPKEGMEGLMGFNAWLDNTPTHWMPLPAPPQNILSPNQEPQPPNPIKDDAKTNG